MFSNVVLIYYMQAYINLTEGKNSRNLNVPDTASFPENIVQYIDSYAK